MAKPRKRYTAAPSVPPQVSERLAMVLEVLAGTRTVSEAARELGMSRNHFQTLLHRGLGALVESITPHAAGRPGKAPEVAHLQAQVESLRRDNARLQDQVGTAERVLKAASGLLQGRMRPARQSRTRKSAPSDDDEGEPARRARKLAQVERMRSTGMTAAWAAHVAGVHESTVRRWKRTPGPCKRVPRVSTMSRERVAQLVRDLRGCVGAEALRHSVPGISRREAARIKHATLSDMERERKATLHRVRVARPDVMRGMDGMYVHSGEGPVHALFVADASVPYRSAVKVGEHYDAHLVAQVLREDIEVNGPPLVYRMDRARAHDAPEVRELLASHQVLLLHGPPHCPRFYGQLERQNREHRAWDADLARGPGSQVEPCLRDMVRSVNSEWRRRSLGWRTASEVWNARTPLGIDRHELRRDVQQRAAKIERQLQGRGCPADLAQRLAIEQALKARGLLRQTTGGWC